ncbi:hypothetical protein ACFYPT_41425 [Streptomyces sp. NPDC005529]|uniref:NHL domain-containing protein n=1 Tax=unclassified Streptomyces TaxID=2593676 RepID=UPI00339DC67D
MTTPIPDDVWVQITSRLDVASVTALLSVDRDLDGRLRENPRTWRARLDSCTDAQLMHLGLTVPALLEAVHQLLKWRAVTTLTGGATGFGFGGDGGPADQATLNSPQEVAVGPDGTVYIADMDNHRVRRIAVDGIITTLVGTGQPGYSGDGGPAHQATLREPSGVAVGPDGAVYIADTANYRVRRVAVDGVITTLVGTGQSGYSGDGGPAHQATMRAPRSVAVGPDGTVYIADVSNNRIRRVAVDGVITTLVGTGQSGYSGDGGPAHQAQLRFPTGVAVGPDGTVYIADTSNNRIRRIPTGKAITTLVGTGQHGFTGDGGPAHLATLAYPRSAALGPDGLIHIVTGHCLRRLGTVR